jgi:hypothetical protein
LVKRDSYLPQGSHGLKAVTKAKLEYDPLELRRRKHDSLPEKRGELDRRYGSAMRPDLGACRFQLPFVFSRG